MVESVPESGTMMQGDRSFGRTVRGVVLYGVMTTVMALSPLVVFVPTALFHCAIRVGRRAAWIAALIAVSLGVAYMVQLTSVPSMTADVRSLAWASLLGVILSVVVPALIVMPMVERGEGFGKVVVYALVAATLGLVGTEAAVRSTTGASPLALQVAEVRKSSVEIAKFYRSNGMTSDFVEPVRQTSEFAAIVLPAWMLTLIALFFVLSLLMLGRLKAWRDSTVSTSPERVEAWRFRHFTLPEWLLFAFVFGGLTPFTTGLLHKVAANTLAVVAVLYLLQGFAVIRATLLKAGVGVGGTLVALMFIGTLVQMGGVGQLLVAVVGLFDPFFHFRNFKRKDESHESHSD
jgi:hypothetical protein